MKFGSKLKSKAWVEVPPNQSIPGTEDDENELLYPEWYSRSSRRVGMRIRRMRHKSKAVTEEGMKKKRKKSI